MTPEELRERTEALDVDVSTVEDALGYLKDYITDAEYAVNNLRTAVTDVLTGLEELEVPTGHTDSQVALLRQASYRSGWDAAVQELTNRRYPAYGGTTHPA